MIITTKITDPYNWHPFFAILPVQVDEYAQQVDGRTVMIQTKAFMQHVQRKLERNLSGTERWVYELPTLSVSQEPKPRWFDSKK